MLGMLFADDSGGFTKLTGEERLQTKLISSWASFLKLVYCAKSDFELLCGHEPHEAELQTVSQTFPCGKKDPKVAFARAWLRIVKDYGRTEFTYESDRLIALSGVAKAIEHSKGFTYVAGTWKELWPMDLLWYRLYLNRDRKGTPKKELANRSRSKAPSWSWAAVKRDRDGVFRFICYDSPHNTDHITYLAQAIDFTSPTSTARYTGTGANEDRITLTIKGGVKRGVVSLYRGTSALKPSFERGDFSVQFSDGSDHPGYRPSWDQIPKVGDSVLLLYLMKGKYSTPTEHLCQWGLVLMLEEGAQNQDGQLCYRRVGLFRELDWEDGNNWEEETVCLC